MDAAPSLLLLPLPSGCQQGQVQLALGFCSRRGSKFVLFFSCRLSYRFHLCVRMFHKVTLFAMEMFVNGSRRTFVLFPDCAAEQGL